MPTRRFWNLMGVMGGQVDQDAVARLRGALKLLPTADVVAFQERLARVLYELDREVLARQTVRFADDPPDAAPIPMSGDTFLYLRAAIVAMGRETFEAVLADPSLLERDEWYECEHLLYVADEVTGDDIETAVSYETRSNQRHWTVPPEPDPEPWGDDRMPVSVMCHDLSNPINAMRPDGTLFPALYPAPDYIDLDELLVWGPTLARIVAVHGGVRSDLGVDQIGIRIDFDTAWRTEPEVVERYDDQEYHVGLVLPVQVAVADADVRSWPADVRAEALMALAAACLLAALPTGHPARPEIQAVHDRGARHLP
jgi:hypothetical protein